MKQIVAVALSLAVLGACQSTDPLAEACADSAAGLRVATVAYKAKQLSATEASVVDHAAAVIDGFCHQGAARPTNLTAAIQAVTVAGGNIAALHK